MHTQLSHSLAALFLVTLTVFALIAPEITLGLVMLTAVLLPGLVPVVLSSTVAGLVRLTRRLRQGSSQAPREHAPLSPRPRRISFSM